MDLSPADIGEGASGQNVADTKQVEASSSGQGQQGASSHGPRTMSKASIMKMHEERIRKMGEKHGIEFGPSDIFSNDPSEMVDRVDKPIRMRVRRLCHQCDTLFSTNNKECSKCHHIRCNSCPRFPSKTKHDRGSANLEEMQAVMKVTREHSANLGNFLSGDYQVELKRLAETGGPGLVHRKPRQRTTRPGEVATSHHKLVPTKLQATSAGLVTATLSASLSGRVLSDKECFNIMPRSIELLAAN
ncbi:hypothetical protein E4U33_000382 [Claviceps sp. LM78 group G4]|nr:hypothetical protein E4U33_000382 [Claviceps sp. LM78 group G4]